MASTLTARDVKTTQQGVHRRQFVRFPVLSIVLAASLGRVAAQSTLTGSMNQGRTEFAATALNNGTVLATGGGTTGFPIALNTAEIYNRVTGTWRYTPFPMNQARRLETATKLLDGRVLIVGGIGTSPGGGDPSPMSAEIFDPTTESFAATPSMNQGHAGHRAILLGDGRVLVIAGDLTTGTSEIYNPSTNTWSLAAPLPAPTIRHDAVLLPDGTVLVSGGFSSLLGITASVYSYNPATNSWRAMAPLLVARSNHTMTVLQNGKVLVVGGSSLAPNSVEIYDPFAGGNGQSQFGDPLVDNRGIGTHTATLLSSGDVVVAGGQQATAGGGGGPFVASIQVFQQATQTWTTPVQLMTTPRGEHTATLLQNGQVLLAGGVNDSGLLNSVELWGPATEIVPVVFLHGYCDSPSGAFGDMPQALFTDTGTPTASFDYSAATQLKDSLFGVESIATGFGQSVKSLLAANGLKHVDVVAHSMGGLVARSWMAGLSGTPYGGEIRRLITLGSPHYGVSVSDVGLWIRETLLGPCSTMQADQLKIGSEFIGKLHDAWEQFQLTSPNRAAASNLIFVAGTVDCSTGNCKDGLVHVQSAVLPDATQIRYVPYKHSNGMPPILTPAIAFVEASSRDSHKAYGLVKELVQNGNLLPQCCGSGTLDYDPPFFHGATTAEGFLLVRVRDENGQPLQQVDKLQFDHNPQVPGATAPDNVNRSGGAFTYFPLIAPDTYHITALLGGGYVDLDLGNVLIQRLRPTVLPAVQATKKH